MINKMNTPNYKKQFDKITEAYIKGEIKPYDRQFCFCGTIGCVGREIESFCRSWDYSLYSPVEYGDMERALLTTIRDETIGAKSCSSIFLEEVGLTVKLREASMGHENYEAALFNGMCAALDVLKKIHLSRGEKIEDTPILEKRILQTQ
jgi:hypothetical protein